MLKIIAITLLFAPAAALAQQAPAVPAQSAGQPSSANDCTHLYPKSAADAGEEGTTVVAVNIAADGMMTAPRVARSSGYPDLDNAALTCVNGGHVKPLTNQGSPIDATADIEVVWRRSVFGGAPAAFGPPVCARYYPPLAVRLNHQGVTQLSFTIAADGSTKNVRVAQSSGYDELDKAAAACVAGFRHWPVTQQGHGVEVDGVTRIDWKLRN